MGIAAAPKSAPSGSIFSSLTRTPSAKRRNRARRPSSSSRPVSAPASSTLRAKGAMATLGEKVLRQRLVEAKLKARAGSSLDSSLSTKSRR
ncbi:MAG: hypothetical protein WCI67_03810 [Chloroflexales bacterium]